MWNGGWIDLLINAHIFWFVYYKAYYGGEARCDQDAAAAGFGDFNPEELICGGCSDVARAQVWSKLWSKQKVKVGSELEKGLYRVGQG